MAVNDASLLEQERPAAGLAEDEWPFEIVDGQRLELPPMSAYASVIAFRLASRLEESGRVKDIGQAVTEVLFQLPLQRERARRPDAAFVSFERWAKGRPIPGKDNAWRVVPNLGIEVVSPHDYAEELLEKIEEYFLAGVQLVWVVFPRQQFVHVYESVTQIRVVNKAGVLDGGAVLPDFRLPLAEIFREETNPD
jgi:Uma2 family endonuclease